MKKYSVKVYTEADAYLTTWDKDIVSQIQFNNEINSAGGQLKITLARNAGDYGEGSDVDFGHRVKVYCADNENPNLLIFQGYISAYTPIYKDNNVEITVLSYGAELKDMICEAGGSIDLTQSTATSWVSFGSWSQAKSATSVVAQTITAVNNGAWNRIDLTLKTGTYLANGVTTAYTNISNVVSLYSGGTVGSGTLLGTSNSVVVANNTEQNCVFTFPENIPFTNGSQYWFMVVPNINGYDTDIDYSMAIRVGAGYAGGTEYDYVIT